MGCSLSEEESKDRTEKGALDIRIGVPTKKQVPGWSRSEWHLALEDQFHGSSRQQPWPHMMKILQYRVTLKR
jgi:hypothetical protein